MPKEKNMHEVGEIIVLEQYLRMLSPALIWITEHNPKSATLAAQLADVFVAAQKKGTTMESHSMENDGCFKTCSPLPKGKGE